MQSFERAGQAALARALRMSRAGVLLAALWGCGAPTPSAAGPDLDAQGADADGAVVLVLADGNPAEDGGVPEAAPDQSAPAADAAASAPAAERALGTSQRGPAGTLEGFWVRRARWSRIKQWSAGATGINGEGSFVKVVTRSDGGGTDWYLFSRRNYPVDDGVSYGACGAAGQRACCLLPPMGLEVRKLRDDGEWSAPTTVVAPVVTHNPSDTLNPWYCAVTDGDAVFDATLGGGGGGWRYLLQCFGIGPNARWNGCTFHRDHADAYGAVTQGEQIAIQGGSIWSRICDAVADRCSTLAGGVGRVSDEGTFTILGNFPDQQGTRYIVGFHGYDGKNGYVGLAQTRDWHAWDPIVDDAIFNRSLVVAGSGRSWRSNAHDGDPVGGGHASFVFEPTAGGTPLWYMFVESADKSLNCTGGQNWNVGVLRSQDLHATSWDQPDGVGAVRGVNPFLYNHQAPDGSCNLSYFTVFRDPIEGAIYATTHRHMGGAEAYDVLELYRLEEQSPYLRNGDFWKCALEDWQAANIASAVYRQPLLAANGSCFAHIHCPLPAGQVCDPGAHFLHQDVAVGAYGAAAPYGPRLWRKARFGLRVAKDASGAAGVEIFAQAFRGATFLGTVAASWTARDDLGSAYQVVETPVFELPDDGDTVRLVVAPRDGGQNLRLGELWLTPQ